MEKVSIMEYRQLMKRSVLWFVAAAVLVSVLNAQSVDMKKEYAATLTVLTDATSEDGRSPIRPIHSLLRSHAPIATYITPALRKRSSRSR
jgi:hypothetical protein